MSNPTDDPRKWPPIITAAAALQAIADLPTGENEDIERGREDAYRAVEALFAEPPEIEARPSSPAEELKFWKADAARQTSLLRAAEAKLASPTGMGVTEERETFSSLKLKAVEALDQLAAYAHNNEALEDACGESARAMHAATWNRVKVEQAVVAIRDMTVTAALHPTSETTEVGNG